MLQREEQGEWFGYHLMRVALCPKPEIHEVLTSLYMGVI